jgi:hypothetical protein
MDEKSFQEQLQQFTTPEGQYFKEFQNNFAHHPELRQRLDDLFRDRYPEPASQPPPTPPPPSPGTAPQIGNPSDKAQGAIVNPAPTSSEKSSLDDYDVAQDHLRHVWRDGYEGNMKSAETARDFIFDAKNVEDEALFARVVSSPMGNDPRVIQALHRIAGMLPATAHPADIGDMSQQQRIDAAGGVAAYLFGRDGRLADNPILRGLADAVDQETLINFGARLFRRIFGK